MKRLRQYTPTTLPKDIKRQLYRLNLREWGLMRGYLVDHRNHDRYYVLTDDDRVIGWAMTTKRKSRWYHRSKREAHYYVRFSERGKKYGLRLARAVYNREGRLKAHTRLFRGMNTRA